MALRNHSGEASSSSLPEVTCDGALDRAGASAETAEAVGVALYAVEARVRLLGPSLLPSLFPSLLSSRGRFRDSRDISPAAGSVETGVGLCNK